MTEAAIFARFMGEAGIFALGWGLFFLAMYWLRLERKRYQELVVHIIQYLTKVNMIQGTEDDATLIGALFGKSGRGRNDGRTRPDSRSANDEGAQRLGNQG